MGTMTTSQPSWQANLLTNQEEIHALLRTMKRVAVLGIKTEAQQGQPSFDVPAYLQRCGVEVVPVPVYYPEVTTILGQPVVRSLAAIKGPVDVLDVFRRPQDIPQHVPEMLALKPAVVWFQLGIRNDEAAKTLAQAGIKVVQDRCILVDHRAATR